MTYEEAIGYILDIPKFTKKNTLLHTEQFLAELGDPQEKMKVIHVAGTNGKGSVCAYVNAMLLSEGKTVGLFTSPHLIKMNERIVINGCEITDEEFAAVFEEVLRTVRQMEEKGAPHPTFFEFLFGMAALAFAKAGVEYAVTETGLGGRLDATNVVKHPVLTVLTSIGMDHMEYLGNTLGQIAAEKAGIIKPGVPVFFAEGKTESNIVIEKHAKKMGCPCKKIGKSAYEILKIQDGTLAFSPSNAYYGDTTWTLDNIGLYQPGNAILALEAMRQIFGNEGKICRWREALAGVRWEGRMDEILPDVYVDGAHNVSAVESFVQSVQDKEKGNIILFSAVRDKDYEEMIACLCRNLDTDFYMITLIDDGRAARIEELQRIFEKYTEKPVFARESLEEALRYVMGHQQDRTIYCLGSLYLTGMIKALIPARRENAVRKQGDKNT